MEKGEKTMKYSQNNNNQYWNYEEIGMLIDLKLKRNKWKHIGFLLARSPLACQRKYENIKKQMNQTRR